MNKSIKYYPCYINGEWLDSSKHEVIEVENPATQEVFATVSACTKEDVQMALETSEKAQLSWQITPANTRAQYIYAIIDRLKVERECSARLLVVEQGKTLPEAFGELDDTIRYLS